MVQGSGCRGQELQSERGGEIAVEPRPEQQSPQFRAHASLAIVLAASLLVAFAVRSGSPSSPVTAASADISLRIDPNTATAAELELLPGVGPTIAANIIAARDSGTIRTPDDLDTVPRIGPKTIERLRPQLALPSGQPASTP